MRELEIQKQIELEKLKLEQERQMQKERMEMEERMQKERMEMEERGKEKERQIQIEREKLKFDTEEKEREKQFNLRMKELEMQNQTVKLHSLDFGAYFDVTKHIRLVPPFQEKEVDKYFLQFEKVAETLKWPKEHWTLLLQSVIIVKAREIYT